MIGPAARRWRERYRNQCLSVRPNRLKNDFVNSAAADLSFRDQRHCDCFDLAPVQFNEIGRAHL